MKNQQLALIFEHLFKGRKLINRQHIHQPALLSIGNLNQRDLWVESVGANKLSVHCQLGHIG